MSCSMTHANVSEYNALLFTTTVDSKLPGPGETHYNASPHPRFCIDPKNTRSHTAKHMRSEILRRASRMRFSAAATGVIQHAVLLAVLRFSGTNCSNGFVLIMRCRTNAGEERHLCHEWKGTIMWQANLSSAKFRSYCPALCSVINFRPYKTTWQPTKHTSSLYRKQMRRPLQKCEQFGRYDGYGMMCLMPCAII